VDVDGIGEDEVAAYILYNYLCGLHGGCARLWGISSRKSYPVSCVFSWDGGKNQGDCERGSMQVCFPDARRVPS
jgi:hypothetical protein